MGLQENCDKLQAIFNEIIGIVTEIQSRASVLLDCSLSDLPEQAECILDDCFEGINVFKKATSEVECIQATIGTNGLFAAAINVGLPPLVALKIANIPGDALITRNITELSKVGAEVTAFAPEKARKQLSQVWMTTALGDQGETSVLKTLVDPDGEDRIEPTEIILKPQFHNKSGVLIKPDFYCESRQLICDAKAWKEIIEKRDLTRLKAVAKKYADALKQGGEVRLYFPKDTYEREQQLLSQLPREYNSIKIKILPMQETYQDLRNSQIFFYKFLKYLI